MWRWDNKEGSVPKNQYFWTVVLEKTLDSRLDCQEIKPVNTKGNQSQILIGKKMSRLKFQYFGSLMWKVDSLEKTLMWEKIEHKRKSRQQRMRWLDIITDSMDMNLSKVREIVKDPEVWHATVHKVSLSDVTEGLNSKNKWN